MSDTSKDFSAFIIRYPQRTNQIFTKVRVSLPFDPDIDHATNKPSSIECDAIWDTGATSSTLTKSLATKLGLKPTGKTKVFNTTGECTQNTYLVNIYLPNKVAISYVNVTECESLVGNFELLIGMDIISQSDFSITNVDGKTSFSFRIPSVEEIDYVQEAVKVKNQRKIIVPIQKAAALRTKNVDRSKINQRRKKEKLRRRRQRLNRKRR